jgi:hypothetical protein
VSWLRSISYFRGFDNMSYFYYYARRAVDPEVALVTRRLAVQRCLKVLAVLTHYGSTASDYQKPSEGDWRARQAETEARQQAYRRGLYPRFARKLGLSGELDTASAEDIVAVTNAAQVQYHLLRQAQQVIDRRRVVLKARGIRESSTAEREKQSLYWHQALERFEDNLGP